MVPGAARVVAVDVAFLSRVAEDATHIGRQAAGRFEGGDRRPRIVTNLIRIAMQK
jgi:hypothetical protein